MTFDIGAFLACNGAERSPQAFHGDLHDGRISRQRVDSEAMIVPDVCSPSGYRCGPQSHRMRSVHSALEQHFKSDRTRALAAAVIDGGATAHAYFCVDPKSQRAYDEHTAFEIGSVTKTMTAALLAEFIARGEVALGDSVAKLLGTSFNGPDIHSATSSIAMSNSWQVLPPLVGANSATHQALRPTHTTRNEGAGAASRYPNDGAEGWEERRRGTLAIFLGQKPYGSGCRLRHSSRQRREVHARTP
jgi:CubicO group peptidase (beta-lactamase class C family)